MTFEMPDTVYDAFQRTAQTWPARDMLCVMPSTAQKYGIEAGALSYRAAQEHVQRYAQAFKGAGYTSGMRVAVLLENRPDFFLVWLAMNSLGLSVVPINPDLRRAELEYLLSHSEPALVIAIASRHLDLRQAIDRLSFDLPLVKECCDLPPPRDGASVAEPKSGQAQEAAVLYTSGTTGNPKGCMHSHATVMATAVGGATGIFMANHLESVIQLVEDMINSACIWWSGNCAPVHLIPRNIYYFDHLPVNADLNIIFGVALTTMILSGFAGFFPARQAAMQDPVQTIRND